MAKQGLHVDTIYPVLKDAHTRTGWSLCIGAGTSSPIIPDWFQLVDSLIAKHCRAEDKINIDEYKKLGFSADAMIQAVKNNLKSTDNEFIQMLSDVIYEKIKNQLTTRQWKSFCVVHNSQNFSAIIKSAWNDFIYIRENVLNKTSAYQLAKVIISAIENDIAPKTILTFNGEAILLAMMNSFYVDRGLGNKIVFDRVLNSIINTKQSRIPYIHCHGVVSINGTAPKSGYIANDKLVFSEDSYLHIANTTFSWQSANFINSCLNSKIVFIGVSLTDSNMRKWLSWIHSNKINELKENHLSQENVTEHFWIKKSPPTKQEKLWIEESVSHLGIRLIWVDEWTQVGTVLNKMLGL